MATAAKRSKIFVVNDDNAFLQLMEQLLEDEGYAAETFRSSKDVYERVSAEQPDLVILDIRINNEGAGLLLLDMLSLDPTTSSIPLIVASANLRALAGREAELAAKGIFVIAKPFDIDELGTLMRTALDRPASVP